ncbi:MAG: DUF4164 family protein, partial [Microcystaceae cyanobacterium]
MNNEPVTVTYSLEEVLTRLEQKIDSRLEQLEQKIDSLQQDVTELKVGQARLEERLSGEIGTLEEKVDGISKRLDYQEFINRGVIVGLIL